MDASLPPWEKIFIKRQGNIYWGQIGGYQFLEGDETLTWDQNHETCWKLVLGKTEHDWDGELVKIKTETGKQTSVTSNHSIFGDNKKTKTNQVNQINAGNLQKGDYVIGFKKFETDGQKKLSHPETIGFWLSDHSKNNQDKTLAHLRHRNHHLELYLSFFYSV